MAWRKWLVRILVFSALGGIGVAGFLYERWTDPAAVRLQVIQQLGINFPGASISLGSAHLRLLGGIVLTELRLARKDDPDKVEFAYFPSAVIYHDKEELLKGKMAIRKVELYRPHIHVVRDRSGRWNVAGIIGIPDLKIFLPTIVIQQGTIYLEDHLGHPDAPAVEIRDVNLTLINDPLTTVTFQAKGLSELIGAIRVGGSWLRRSMETSFTMQANDIAVNPALVERLAPYFPEAIEHARQLEGTANFKVDFGYHPDSPQPMTHDLVFQLTRGKLRHPDLPLELNQLEATVHCNPAEVRLESLSAMAGGARIHLEGSGQALDVRSDFRGTLTINHLPITSQVFQGRFLGNLKKIGTDYAPQGPVSLTFQFERQSGQWWRRCVIHPEDLSATFVDFPYTLEHITGTLDQEINKAKNLDVLKIDLVGRAGDSQVFIKGTVNGGGPLPAMDLKIWGDDLALDDKVVAALPTEFQELAHSLHATGLGNFEAFLHRDFGIFRCNNRFVTRFHHAAIRFAEFPYPLDDVSAVLDIQPGAWELRDFHGSHHQGDVRIHGQSYPTAAGNGMQLDISGENIRLDDDFEAALQPQPDLKHAWKEFAPSGGINFWAKVKRPPTLKRGQEPEVDVTVDALNCSIRPVFFSCLLTDLNGRLRYSQQQVVITKLSARHGRTNLSLDRGQIFLKPGGGIWADLVFLHFDPLMPEDDLLPALPPMLAKIFRGLKLKDPLTIKTWLRIDSSGEVGRPPVVFWDGEMGLHDATLSPGINLEHLTGRAACRGRHDGHQLQGLVGNVLLDEATIFKQPFRNIQTHLEVKPETPELLELKNISSQIFGGTLGGAAQIEFSAFLRYELNLTAAQVRLEEFGQHNLGPGTPLSGLASARLYLRGQGAEVADLGGGGTIDVPKGRLYHLPLLLDLLKFLGLRLPDGTAFEETHAAFTIRGPRLMFSRLDLFGNSFSLRGEGEMNLDGTDLNLDFYAVLSRTLQMLPSIIKDSASTISRYFLKIKMRGKIGDVHFTKEPVPVLVDPIKDLLKRMSGRNGAASQGLDDPVRMEPPPPREPKPNLPDR